MRLGKSKIAGKNGIFSASGPVLGRALNCETPPYPRATGDTKSLALHDLNGHRSN
jgi:hypothetical protein